MSRKSVCWNTPKCYQVQRMKPNETKKIKESQKSTFLFPFCSLKTKVILYSIDLHYIVN